MESFDLSGQASFPVAGFSPAMSDGRDLHSVRGQTKYDAEWKSPHDETLRTRNKPGPTVRSFGYLFNRAIKFGKEGICC
jgi:hypothetical protein